MARQRSGFAWPVMAALIVIPTARLVVFTIVRFGDAGIVAVILVAALAVVIGGVVAWQKRRVIRDWAAKEPQDQP
jgi:membrane protein YqaA with SNARE-associated domain